LPDTLENHPPDAAGAPRPASSAPVWGVLGTAVMVLLPFGVFGVFGVAAVALAGIFAFNEVINVSSVLLAGALFLLAGPEGIQARLWPAFKWGAGAVLLASVPLSILAYGVLYDWVDANRFALLHATLYIDMAWLVVLSLVAWRGPADDRRLGIFLGLVVSTSRLMMFPLLMLGMIVATDDGMGIILTPVLLAGLAVGMLLVLLTGALVAWLAWLLRRWLHPRLALAGAAALFAVMQAASLIWNLRGE
jgi:hypothetical protein